MTIGEVFIKAHTKKNGSFVDKKAKLVAEAYEKNKQAKLADLQAENSESSDGTSHPPQLSLDQDNELFLLVNCFCIPFFNDTFYYILFDLIDISVYFLCFCSPLSQTKEEDTME